MKTSIFDWVTSLSTAGALVIALYVFRFQLREQERSQASGVATWVQRTRHGESTRAHVVVKNASPYPVYDVWVWDGTEWDQQRKEFIADPGSVHDEFWYVIGPGETIHCEWDLMGAVIEDPWLELTFTDSAGRHWQRRGAKLHRVRKRRDIDMGRWGDAFQS